LIEPVAAGDISLFFYAGHGSQVTNSKSTELDLKDETIVPADAMQGTRHIRDKELARLFHKALGKGTFLTAIFDSCHTGSIAHGYPLPVKARYLPPDPRDVADPPDSGPTPEQRGALVLSAAQDYQVAEERSDDQGVPHGLFSRALLKILQTAPIDEPAEHVFSRISTLMRATGRPQVPVFAGSAERRQRPLFGGEPGALSGRITVAVLKVMGKPAAVTGWLGGWAEREC
jgi:Caspase domain